MPDLVVVVLLVVFVLLLVFLALGGKKTERKEKEWLAKCRLGEEIMHRHGRFIPWDELNHQERTGLLAYIQRELKEAEEAEEGLADPL